MADNTVIWQNYHTTLTDAAIKRRLETTHLETNKASCFKSHPASTYFQTTAEYIDIPVLMALSLYGSV